MSKSLLEQLLELLHRQVIHRAGRMKIAPGIVPELHHSLIPFLKSWPRAEAAAPVNPTKPRPPAGRNPGRTAVLV